MLGTNLVNVILKKEKLIDACISHDCEIKTKSDIQLWGFPDCLRCRDFTIFEFLYFYKGSVLSSKKRLSHKKKI